MQKKPPASVLAEGLTTSSEDRPPLNDHWRARRELAAVVRRLNSAMMTTGMSTAALEALTTALRTEVEGIEAGPHRLGNQAQAEIIAAETGAAAPFMYHEMSPVMGHANPHAPPLHIWQEDGRIHGRATVSWDYEGPPDHVHGGVVAMLFDQLLGFGQRISGTAGPTGSLTVRYHRPTPLHKPLHFIGEVERIEGRKKFMTAKLMADDVCTASCEGVFIIFKELAESAAE